MPDRTGGHGLTAPACPGRLGFRLDVSIGGYIVQRPWQAVLAPGTSAAGSSRWRCGWWNAVWPGLAIGAIVVVFGTTLLGDGLGKS